MERLKKIIYVFAAHATRATTAVEDVALALVTYYRQNLRLTERLMSIFLPDSEDESAYEKTHAHYHYGQKKHGGITDE
jgi:hypothetical protein